jgi:acetyl-CoA synthetase
MNANEGSQNASALAFMASRDFLIANRLNYKVAYENFVWPKLDQFNWAIDWFDYLGKDPRFKDTDALWIVEQDNTETKLTFQELSERSNKVANWFTELGIAKSDRVVVMLGNQVELWETILALMKIGAVMIPCTTLLTSQDLTDRIERASVKHVIVKDSETRKFEQVPGDYTKIAVGEKVAGWYSYADAYSRSTTFTTQSKTYASDTLLLYFTSGTTAKPKLVEHTHASYPVGHLSTMYWIGIEPYDIHLNISSPGWAKHAWSCVFAPWNAGATVFIYNYARFDAQAIMTQIDRCKITSFCAPPTVWRMMIQADLTGLSNPPTKLVSAGEPLNPEVIEQVERAWGVTIRDGYGQTETTAIVGNSPGQEVKKGSMGRPLPGFKIELVDPNTGEPGSEGEICISLSARPTGLMVGYKDDPSRNQEAMEHGLYHTGDIGMRDADGYITYVGRSDDVFKASDYRISPFELESALLEHPAVAEAAVVPSPDPLRLNVPKAYITLAAGYTPSRDTALSIFKFSREHLAPYKRIRRLEFVNELPKTISGKIRRVELRAKEQQIHFQEDIKIPSEWEEKDFPELFS